MADAREALLHRLSNYAKYEGMEVIVVFDAQLVPGIQQNYKKYQLDVVLRKKTKRLTVISRIAGQLNDRLTQVTVATSDLAEQWMIFPKEHYELLLMNYKTIKNGKTIAQENKDMHFIDFRRNSPWNEEQLKLSQNWTI